MRKILKVILVLFTMALLFGLSTDVSAETNDENNEVQLNYSMTADNSFKFYISESDTEKGDLLLSGNNYTAIYQGSSKLKAGKKYYLHIEATDSGSVSGFLGSFGLNGNGLLFSNNSNALVTNVSDFKVSKTGFGQNYLTPTICTYKYSISLSTAKWIWTNYGKDVNCTRYFSATIIPDLVATATGNYNEVDLTWTSIDKALSYSVARSTTQNGPYTTIATDLTTSSYIDKDIDKDITYYYVITAKLSDAENMESDEVSATPLTATPSALKVVLEVGEELQLSVDDDLDINTEMTWTSSDNTVATVDGDGVVTALKPGNTIVTVVSKDGSYTDKINVLVVENANDYRLAIDLKVGKSCRLTVDDLTDTVKVTWNSSDTSVATISSKGKVTAVSGGLTLITATDEDGNIIGQVYVRVRE